MRRTTWGLWSESVHGKGNPAWLVAEWAMSPSATRPWDRNNNSWHSGDKGARLKEGQFHTPGAGPKLPTSQWQQTGTCTVTQVASCYPTIYPTSRPTPKGQQTEACIVIQVVSCHPTICSTSRPATGKAAAQALGCTGDAVGERRGERRAGQGGGSPHHTPSRDPCTPLT